MAKTQKDFKEFEKAFNKVRQVNQAERIDAVGTLSPALLRKHLKSGKDLALAYGTQGLTVKYTLADLKKFADQIEKVKDKTKSSVAGLPLLQLEKSSWSADKLRAKIEIRNATLYKVVNNTLHFQVTASGKSEKRYHQVRVRLEEWYDNLTDPNSWLVAARDTAVGRLSFDCSCGRHQYWFRYLATIGNFALTPKEKDFPKIRNPELKGCCCKHVLKVLQQLKSPSIHNLLAKEMKSQAESAGYVDKGNTRYLNAKELAKAKRAKGSKVTSKAVEDAYKKFKQAKDAFAKKLQEKKVKEKIATLEAERKAYKSQVKQLREQAKNREKEAQLDKLKFGLKTALDMAKKYKAPREEAIEDFAKENNVAVEDINKLIEDNNL